MVQSRPISTSRRLPRSIKRRAVQRIQESSRSLKLETLERRELLAAELMQASFAPGTPQDVMDQWASATSAPSTNSLGDGINLQGSRWTNPASGPSPNLGDAATVTWSIVPDGTPVSGTPANEVSDLIAFMDGIYGGGGNTVDARPWFPIFEQMFDDWSAVSGLTMVYEANDDGLAQGGNAIGELGVRGDIRIGGGLIDGNSNVLAFNYYPTGGGNSGLDGDMVIDTGDNFYSRRSDGVGGENRGLHNVLMHEVGHGIGLGHVIPVNGTKLMEPSISLNYFGAQHDDILAAQSLYGDRYGDNDTATGSVDIGQLIDVALQVEDVSIDDDSDADWYSFSAAANQLLTLAVVPEGETYDVGPQGGSPSMVDSTMHSDLRFELYDPSGALLASGDSRSLGEPEFVAGLPILETGTYSVAVFGTAVLGPTSGVTTSAQLYTLTAQRSDLSDPNLIAVAPNRGEVFDLDPQDQVNNLRTTAPTELTLTFGGTHAIDPNTLDGITVEYSESGNFASDGIQVPIGYAGLDASGRNVDLRFAENLADGFYQLSISSSVSSTFGVPFLPDFPEPVPGDPDLTREVVSFEVELGAKIVSVVPQPIQGGTPQLDQIDVYFDDVDLFRAGSTVGNADFYQLVDTQNSATTQDDQIHDPRSVVVDADARKVTLFFDNPLGSYTDGGDSLRLRIGDSADFTSISVNRQSVTSDPGMSQTTATNVGTTGSGSWTVLLGEQIRNGSLPNMVDNPGGTHEPGHRDIEVEDHYLSPGNRDSNDSITTIPFTFLRNTPYGTNSQGDPLFNQMDADQEQRFREILSLYSTQLGIDFYETERTSAPGLLRLIVGDLSTADPTVVSGPGGVAGLGGPGRVTMDAVDFQNAESNQFGGSFFDVALHEIGHAIGLGHTYDLAPGTVQGSSGEFPDSDRPGPGTEWQFPGDNDIVHGLYLHQRESLDVDLYRVAVTEKGTLRAQTFAERMPDASLLDSRLSLFQQLPGGQLELVAANDDYFGADSLIEVEVQAGEVYFVGVSSEGNSQYDPETGLPSDGGTSEGDYELRLDFVTAMGSSIADADGSSLDGDRDGVVGGNYDHWFEPVDATTIYVGKDGGQAGPLGSVGNPYGNVPDALDAAEAATLAGAEGVVVRLMPSAGPDGEITTTDDNVAYEFGIISSLNQVLEDGRNLIMPSGVHLVVDAGSILKFLDSRVSVGSDDDGDDRSEASISVHGTPDLPVYFTSYNDRSLGSNSNVLGVDPQPGNWGGIEIRNDVDRSQGRIELERLGIFQNYINHAEFSYGGGEVSTVNRIIDPIYLSEARAEISYNSIRSSSDAAVSADPNTFEITTFTEPRFQKSSVGGSGFVSDYQRHGPSIYGNHLVGNSTNGLFVRIDTPAGGGLEMLEVPARFDDTDIVHVLGENLLLRGQPGGPVEDSGRPNAIIGVTASSVAGDLSLGTYGYSYTFIDKNGFESPGSAVQLVTLASGDTSVSLTDIPQANGQYVGRRVYRSFNGGPFRLVAELDKSQPDHNDTLGAPPTFAPVLDTSDFAVRHGRIAGTLVVDPGTIVKNQGARIQLGFGSALLAEGLDGQEVVMTARADDRFGAGGTFDTNGDGQSSGAPADWAGIYASPTSRLSLDRARISYAGGVTGVNGGTASFNAVQLHQAEARIANSLFEDNASGVGSSQINSRRDFAPNGSATIYATAAQPVIVGNTFIENSGSPININVNSFGFEFAGDVGRQTGLRDAYEIPPANNGPVIRGNRLTGNAINGMVVRGEVLTTAVVLDDTDIVHVLQRDIEIPDLHTYGGMRLESSTTESLVVKVDNAEILATGRSLDIDDRIGGRLHVIGQPGFPVIMTSVNDDTVGAGFTPDGQAQTETITGGGSASPGDWQGLRFDAYSHDRNVAVAIEQEGEIGGFGDSNSVIGTHQDLGLLAANEKSGDENIRLGYTVHGAIASDQDQDLYSFEGVSGTMVWIDIDQTDRRLDTVLELIDGNGRILALSQDSRQESGQGRLTYVDSSVMRDGHALPMQLDHDAPRTAFGDYRDLFTINDGDSGMRVVLPGTSDTRNTFYIRVRSNNRDFDQRNLSGINAALSASGQSKGGYQLQVRLSEVDEHAGSVVRNADLRYATVAIEATGLPAHSPIAGELFNAGGTLDLGSLANLDRAAISVAGNAGTVDSYTFTVDRDALQGINPTDNSLGVVIDVDYADGLTRPNTNAWLFDGGNLIAIGTDSNVTDDRVTPLVPGQETTETDLSRGSFGARDAFIGPLELSPNGSYEVIVTNDSQMPADMEQFVTADPDNPFARLEPIDSTVRIIDDRFDYRPGTGVNDTPIPDPAETGPLALQVGFEDDGSNIIPWQFGDIPLIALREDVNGNDASRLSIYNPFTGRHDAVIEDATAAPLGAIAQSQRGEVLAIANNGNAQRNDANTSTTYVLDTEGAFSAIGATGIVTWEHFNNNDADPTTNTNRVANDGMVFESLAYYNDNINENRFLYGLANRGFFSGSTVIDNNGTDALSVGTVRSGNNLIYLLDPDTGTAISRRGTDMVGGFESADPTHPLLQDQLGANFGNFFPNETAWGGTNIVAQVQIPTFSDATGLPTGDVTSLVTDVDGGTTLFAFTDQGAVWEIAIARQTGGLYSAGDLIGQPRMVFDPTVSGGSIIDTNGERIAFEQVTRGPEGFLDDVNDAFGLGGMYFGVGRPVNSTIGNRFYAFDIDDGKAEPVFQFGADSVDVDDATYGGGTPFAGLFFSSLDSTLWHVSDTLRGAQGHGMGELDDRENIIGGGSLRFGFDPLNGDFNHLSHLNLDGDDGIVSDNSDGNTDLDADDLQGYNDGTGAFVDFNGYNFLGGAHGSVQSNVLDLRSFSEADLPTLYFTYLLDTENVNTNSDLGDFDADELDDVMRDSLRVSVAGEDGQWQLVATNNIADSIDGRTWEDSRDDDHEYDPIGSQGYTDVRQQRFVQELFDDDLFRQARIDLGPWAGQENVRIRFDFSTSGEARPDQSEIHALPGERIADGHLLTISGAMPDRTSTNIGDTLQDDTKVFEFDHGLVAQMPAGRHVTSSLTLTRPDGSVVVELVRGGGGGAGTVAVGVNDSAEVVADKVQQALGASIVRSASHPEMVGFTAESVEGDYGFGAFTDLIIAEPGTEGIPIPIDISMSAFQVNDEIQTALATEIRFANQPVRPEAFPKIGNTNGIRLYDLSVTQVEEGVVSEPGNDSLATAQNIDEATFTLRRDDDIPNSTSRPHTTVVGVGNNTYDYFSFTVEEHGTVASFAISDASFDTELHLFNLATGALLATDDDSGPGLDALIRYTFAEAGTYAIGVAGYNSFGQTGGITGQPVPNSGTYSLHVSLDGKPATPGASSLTLINGEFNSDANQLPGSEYGVYSDSRSLNALLRAGERSRGLGGANGVYLDDIVIGLADRGESFSGSTQGTTLIDNPYFEALYYDALSQEEVPVREEITSGTYQLEVRLGREYLGDDNDGKEARIGINERLADGLNLQVVSSGANLIDGDTFQLSNGFETLTFEFNDVTVPGTIDAFTSGNVPVNYRVFDTAGQVADAVMAAINSGSARDVLGVEATSSDGERANPVDATILLHGYAAATNLGGTNFRSPESGRNHLTGIITGGDNLLRGHDNGDRNRHRDQGVFIVDSNVISFSENEGINVSAESTAPGNKVPNEGNRPKPGAVQNLRILSTEELIHGAVVQNNLLVSNGDGIVLGGNGALGGPNVYTRILNNTIYNSNNGIAIRDQASPTLLNNVLVDNTVGIDASNQGPTVIRATVFDGNGDETVGISTGTEAIINPGTQLFVNPNDSNFNPASGMPNFYPAAGSVLIDSSIESQLDRPSIVSVKDAAGIPRSPIVVTSYDLAGQIRANGSTTSGQGQNINIDRGALDRSDSTGPQAQIIVPGDNDADFIDFDRTDTFLHLREGSFQFFEVLITEEAGIGPNAATITADQISVTENGRRLIPGSEVIISYSSSNRTLRVQSPAGLWRPDAVYEIILLNRLTTLPDGTEVTPVSDLAGNPLQPNRADGQTRFTIVMPQVELDLGDAPDSYGTKFGDNGARHAIVNRATPRLGQYVDGEVDSVGVGSDDLPAILSADGMVREAGNGPFDIAATGGDLNVGLNALPTTGDNISVTAANRTVVFELIEGGGPVTVGRVPVDFPAGADEATIMGRLAAVMQSELLAQNVQAVVEHTAGTSDLKLVAQDDEDGALIGPVDFNGVTLEGVFIDPATGQVLSFLNPLAPSGAQLAINTIGGGFLDAWVDFNGDGDFYDAGEQVLASEPIIDGENRVQLLAPASPEVLVNGTGFTWARFRLSTTGGQNPDGLAVNGEVEDYRVFVAAAAVPEPVNDVYPFDEDTILNTTGVSSIGDNDSKAGASGILYELQDSTTNGTLTLDPSTGEFIYEPNADFYGADTFTYRLTGTQTINGLVLPVRSSTLGTVTLDVIPVNDTPLAVDRSYVTTEPSDTNTSTAVTITKEELLQGSLPQDDALSRVAPWDELEQSLKVVQIAVQDANGTSIDIVELTDPTTPLDGTYTGESYVDDGAGNRFHAGTLTVTVTGAEVTEVIYQPADDYNEHNPTESGVPSLDQFVFTVADDGATTLPDGTLAVPQPDPETTDATVTVQVRAQNDTPTSVDDVVTGIAEDSTVVITNAFLLGNDYAGSVDENDEDRGANGNDGSLSVIPPAGPITTAAGGTVTVDTNGDFVYAPAADFYGPDSFEYSIVDQGVDVAVDGTTTSNPKSSTASVLLTVDPVNDQPSTTDKSFETDEGTPITITAAELFASSIGDADAMHAAPQDEANQLFRIVAIDADGTAVTAANAAAGPFNTPHGQVDANFDANGHLIDLVYTPAPDFNSTDFPDASGNPILDLFGFTVEDDGIAIDPAGGPDISTTPERIDGIATILVNSINDVPTLDDLSDLTIDEDSPLQTITMTGISAGGGEPQDIRFFATSSDISLFANPIVNYVAPDSTGTLQFTPRPDRYGSAVVTVTIEDAGLDGNLFTAADNLTVTKSFTVTVEPVNDEPGAIDREFVTLEEVSFAITAAELLQGSAGDADPRVGPPQNEATQSTQVSALIIDGVRVDASTVSGNSYETGFGIVEPNFGSDGFLVDLLYTPNEDVNADNPRDGLNRRFDTFGFVVRDDGFTVLADGTTTTNLPPAEGVGTVSVSVRPRNDAPVPGGDLISAASADWNDYFVGLGLTAPDPTEDISFVIPRGFLLANDLNGPAAAGDETGGLNDGPLSIVQQTIETSLGGRVTFLANGNMSYAPNANTFGLDTFVYTVSDQGVQEDEFGNRRIESLRASATVSILLDAVNDPPVLDPPNPVTMFEDAALRTVVLTGIEAGGGESQDLRVTASSNDTGLLPDPIVTYTSPDSSATLGLLPNPDRSGVTTVNVVIEDGGLDNDLGTSADNLTVTRTFIVRVRPVNDVPTLDPLSDRIVMEEASDTTVNLSGISAGGGESQPIRVIATSSDPTLVANPSVTYTSADAIGSITFAPEPDQYGAATITVTVEDGGLDGDLSTAADNLSVQQEFVLTVTPSNDAPSLDPLVDVTSPEDAGPQDVSLTGISSGPSESQELRITATSSDIGLISDPTISYTNPSSEGVLTYVSNPDQFGTAIITVKVEDGGEDGDLSTIRDNRASSQSFQVTITPINDVPTLDEMSDREIPEDSGVQTVPLTGLTAGGGESQPISVQVSSSNPALIPDPVLNYTSPNSVGSLQFESLEDQTGSATISIVIEDGGLDGDLTTTVDNGLTTKSFVVSVSPVNDAPTLDAIATQTIDEDSLAHEVQLAGITAGAQESDPLRVTATSGDPSLVSDLVVTYSSPNQLGSLVLTAQPDQFGTTTVTVTVEDGGLDGDLGTAGDNATFDQTFEVVVLPVNDAPTLDRPADDVVDEDSAEQSIALSGITAGAGEVQPLRITASSDRPLLIPDPSVTYTDGDATGTLTYQSLADQFGIANITVTVEDGGLDQDLATADDNGFFEQVFTVTVNNVDDTPQPVDDYVTTDEDAMFRIDSEALLSNDIDVDLDPSTGEQLFVVLPDVSTSELGATVRYDSVARRIIFDPTTSLELQSLAPGEQATDMFEYSVTDADGEAVLPTATVFVTVNGINDAPIVGDDLVESFSNTEPTVIRPLVNDVDVDGSLDIDSVIITVEPILGSIARRIASDGSLELAYSPFAGFTGNDTFRYTIADNLGQASAQATVTIVPSNAPITMSDQGGGVARDGVTIDVAANDVARSGSLDLSSITIVEGPANGTALPNGDGTVTYQPDDGYFGDDEYRYTIADGLGNQSRPTRVRVRVVASGLENPMMFGDVNASGEVTALDALLVINTLSQGGGSGSVPVNASDRGPNYFDVNGNMSITALDALLVINFMGSSSATIEGESVEPIVADIASTRQTRADAAPLLDANGAVDAPGAVDAKDEKIFDASESMTIDGDVLDVLALSQHEGSDEEEESSAVSDLALLGVLN